MSPSGRSVYRCMRCDPPVQTPRTELGLELMEIHRANKHADKNWRKYAACRGMDVNIFFPEQGDTDAVDAAKDICSRCSVTTECFVASNHAFGQRTIHDSGVWGGLTPAQRKKKRARLRIEPATEVLEDWLFDSRSEPPVVTRIWR